jgi:voltage-gated potassium channel Kch
MKKRVPDLKARLGYHFDNIMSRGTAALVTLLFLITAAVVVVTGILGSWMSKDIPAGVSIWQSLMHALDAGTLAGDDTRNIGFLIIMSAVTLCGIFVTSILIGIISTGFEQKLNALRKGASKVIESGHTVIIGFNDGIYTLLSELIEAGANQKKNCIVVVGEQEKESMEELIKGHIRNLKTTRIIVKSGKPTEDFLLSRASVETSRSIIVNQEDDFSVIKTILAVVNHLKAHDARAAVIYTAGSSLGLPNSIWRPGRTMAVHLYILASEGLSNSNMYATATVLIITVLIINFAANRLISRFIKA